MLSFKKVLIFVLVSFFWVELLAQSSYLFTPSNTLGHIEYLASEHMKGRRAGSQEGLEAARYISHLVNGVQQLSMFENTPEMINLYQTLDRIRKRFGEKAIFKATAL
jgi:hypothetical protein